MASTNLWQSLLRDSSVRAPIPSTQVLLLGGTEVGKSSLLQRWQGAKNPNERVQTLAVLPSDFTSFHVPSEEDPACQLNVWSVNTDGISSELSFLSLAIDAQKLRHTVALVAIDGSKPWTVKATLEKWLSTLHTVVQDKLAALPENERSDLLDANVKHFQSYVEPGQPSTPSLVKDDDLAKSLPDGVLTHNAGIPVVVVVCKSDAMPEDTVKADFIQYTIRHLALAYGAAVCFTSSKTGANLDVLKDYVMHRSHPNAFKCAQPPKLVDRSAIFVPSGYDSTSLIEQSLVGSQPRWQKTTTFDKFIPAPVEKSDESALLHPEIRVDPNQVWLRKLEKAAGAGLADLQRSSVEASRRTEELAAARRADADTRKGEKVDVKTKDTKDVNPKHLANFFNNLLSRPDKQKGARLGSIADKSKAAKDVKELAEEEMKKM
ncbi:hypothetical protein, variant 1 [Aphanomyces astaci]|uniref:Dynein light intermediate chain n=1 Tax=Aphanomyces astaci TaxID=112090 RepID=W4GLX2_APHAT|nr:hypothetical protein, variant 1 [Aphanomyces astaci]ETV80366.1 hypothetical protein, variant 1 [Aphanomyces astaci]|eukprot:XP_009830290.1 hypothetical protein, variant 1 [Aphanomyces astaci]